MKSFVEDNMEVWLLCIIFGTKLLQILQTKVFPL